MKSIRNLGILLASLAVLGGCGKSDQKVPATQVAAKVNGAEISIHQINDVLAKAQGVTAENAGEAKREILDKLIDQQLAIAQAEADKLDRNPNVMRSLEAARRDILARAHLEQVAAAQPKATAEEAGKYYAEHPELFAARRVYNLQELLAGPDSVAEVRQLVAQNKSMQEIADSLTARKIKFGTGGGVRPAEQLPLHAVARLHGLKDGQTTVIESPQGAMVVHIVASQSQPVSEQQALPSIQQFLTNQRAGEAVANNMKALRDKAKIERVGEFAEATGQAAKPAAVKVETPKAADQADKAAAMSAQSISKGVAGLK